MPLISIIVPVYNVEKYLEACIETLRNQSIYDLEFIFINDGSTDSSLDILRKYEKIDERIVVINQENKGVSETRNIGIKYATGSYIGFVDPDDTVETNMFELMYNKIIEKNSDLIICDYLKIFTNENKILFKKLIDNDLDKIYNIVDFILKHFLTIQDNGYVFNKLYNRKIIIENNVKFNPNISIHEDLLFNLEFLNYTRKIDYTNEYLYKYYIRNTSATFKLHKTKFYSMKYLYLITIRNCEKWKKYSENTISCINNKYISYPYVCSREIIANNKLVKKEKITMIKEILNDYNTYLFISKIQDKKVKVKFNVLIFYKLSSFKNVYLVYLYLYIINTIYKLV